MAGMSNKSKAMGKTMVVELGKAMEPAETRIMVCVEDTNIDGKTQKTYKIKPCCMDGEEAIFTDKQKFIDELSKRVDEKSKAEAEESDESESED